MPSNCTALSVLDGESVKRLKLIWTNRKKCQNTTGQGDLSDKIQAAVKISEKKSKKALLLMPWTLIHNYMTAFLMRMTKLKCEWCGLQIKTTLLI